METPNLKSRPVLIVSRNGSFPVINNVIVAPITTMLREIPTCITVGRNEVIHLIETEIDLQTADGEMNTFVVHPEEGEARPVVLFLMDAPGMREELRKMCRRLATAGYFVIASNLYYRLARS